MAAAAVSTKLIIVDIICSMTTATTGANDLHPAYRVSVAVIAGNTDVSAAQFEIGLQIVVKSP